MKKFFALCGIVATLLVACEPITPDTPNNTDPTFEITSKHNISVGAGSAMGIITYTIPNPVAGLTIEATANVEWINSFDYSQMGKIGYKVDTNPMYDERVGVITITYDGYSVDLNLKQAGKTRPQEVKIEATYALGHYFGDYANTNYNYYLVLSSSDYDANDSFYDAGTKFFLDVYSAERPADYNNIRVPNGVYTFNPDNDGRAGTFLESYSVYKEYEAYNVMSAEKSYSEGTLTVTDDMIKLEVIFEGETDMYVVTYEGDYSMMDKRKESGAIY